LPAFKGEAVRLSGEDWDAYSAFVPVPYKPHTGSYWWVCPFCDQATSKNYTVCKFCQRQKVRLTTGYGPRGGEQHGWFMPKEGG